MKKTLLFLCSILLMLPISSQAQDGNTVYDIIANSPEHTTLTTILGFASLTETLQGEGSFTVFAPTNAAIGALPAQVIDDLLADPNGALRDLLLYHVIEGNVLAADLFDGTFVRTLVGEEIFVTVDADGVFINNAKVTVADIMASNGVVHVIDVVLMPAGPPPPKGTVVDVIKASPDHTSLSGIITIAGLEDALSEAGPFTVFAPTNAAISALPEHITAALLADPMGQLTQVLTYHVVSGIYPAGPISTFQSLTTLQGEEIMITTNEQGIFINNAKIIATDLLADNGIIHVLDAVLVPTSVVIEPVEPVNPVTPVNLTFTVDMSKETVAPEGVFIAGSFNEWTDQALTDFDNGLWSTFIAANPGDTIEYKFKNGPEGWEGTIEGACSAGGSGNRQYIITAETVSLPLVCFNSCLDCTAVQGEGTGNGETNDEAMDTMNMEEVVIVDVQSMPLMFESSTIEYQLFGFGAPDGPIPTVIINNPDASGENASGKVLSITKSEGAQTWAGVAMPVEGGFDFSGSNVIEMNVWSPRAGVPFLLKIEDTNSPPDANGNPSIIAEVQVSTTVANAWEVLSFDMAQFGAFDATNGYNQIVVFPDFGNAGTGETFYVDGISNANTTATVDIIQLNAFKVSPNPFQHSTSISWDNPTNQSYQVKLLSVTGQTLRAFQDVTGSTFTLTRAGLEAGLYFLNFQDEQGGTGTLKLLVK